MQAIALMTLMVQYDTLKQRKILLICQEISPDMFKSLTSTHHEKKNFPFKRSWTQNCKQTHRLKSNKDLTQLRTTLYVS